MNQSEWLALLLLSVLWGGSFFFAGVQIKALPPFTIVLLRVGLAAAILNVLVKALGMRMPGTRARLARVFRNGPAQQRRPILPGGLGPEPYRFRVGGDPQCHDANIDRCRGSPADT
jgi:drug/metabolite transporter (DMT)-like permease